jgi:Transketolase, C-terminal domain
MAGARALNVVGDCLRGVQIGKGVVRLGGSDVALVGYGSMVSNCLAAAEKLSGAGVSATVVDARFCKPLDAALMRQVAAEHAVVITVEEGSIGGAFAHHALTPFTRGAVCAKGMRVSEESPFAAPAFGAAPLFGAGRLVARCSSCRAASLKQTGHSQSVLFGVQNRTLVPSSAAIHWIPLKLHTLESGLRPAVQAGLGATWRSFCSRRGCSTAT